jgi:hypothetical protein
MDREEFERMREVEGLSRWVHIGSATLPDRVCVFPAGKAWELVITDERAVPQQATRRTFSDEGAALEGALRAARMLAGAMGSLPGE